ncbi:MAG: 50S ribosomal protein L29 [Candidatus Pelagibacter sp.]|nr:50S ribosomal protein L29 [Candidatus Pelagibacter sp.]OUW11803.1 MAG: 50S ribosomal protein L29 [Candidatus Pelagibacter sp. TMED166]|tara:strand:+ start:10596 stop:10793 length:198 start_codon:yes stop_codon:yes gene_type:complete
MKTSEIRKLSQSQLKKELLSYKKEQFNLRFQKINSQVKNTSRHKMVRKTIAKILTYLNKKESEKK